jgi:hypothetical protein
LDKNNISTNTLPLSETLKNMIDKRLLADSNLAPVIINIRDFSVLPKDSSGWSRDQLKIDLRFQSSLNDTSVDFAAYSFSGDLYKYMKNQKYYFNLLQNELPGMIEQLNRIINNSYNDFPYNGLKIISAIRCPELNVPDTIFYNIFKKLSLKDFKGSSDILSEASAATSSSFLYNASEKIKEGYKVISVNTQCFFLKNKSWIKADAMLRYILDHEQLHFDITYLWALKFSNAINKVGLTMENWREPLDKLNKEYFAEMIVMQTDYDRESDSGRDGKFQKFWAKKIKELIKESLQ